MQTSYAWAVCQLGAEPALKAEIARLHAGWRFAYSRPGLVTWKTDAPIGPDVALGAVFARAWGASIGKATTDEEILDAARRVGEPVLLQVFERSDEGDGSLAATVQARLAPGFPAPRLAKPGERVLDVVVAPDEPHFLGLHAHASGRSPHPGGRPPLVLPAEAPSRAWLKLEEALAWSQLPVKRGDVAVEIGSAPGGASWALLERGLTVVGVDPGDMDERVLARPAFTHVKLALGELRREQLPERVDWLLMDVNLAPQVAVHGVRRIVSTLRRTLRGVIFTLKLNDWKMAAEVPSLIERVSGMGLADVRATQLPSNRREICVVGIHQRKK